MLRKKLLSKYIFVIVFLSFMLLKPLIAAEPITISKNFTLFTAKNFQGWLQPLVTSVGESMNSNVYTTAAYPTKFWIGLDISGMGMFIPDGQKTYNAERPDQYGNTGVTKTAEFKDGVIVRDYITDNLQPTIYGGRSNAIFAVPQTRKYPDTTYKSSAYVEGNNISFMSGLPSMQLIFGAPSHTELRFRFWGAPVQGESLWYYGILLNQQFDHFFHFFPKEYNMAIAINGGYHSLSRTPGLSLTGWNAGVHFSKVWDYDKSGKITGYFGLQFEGLSGTFEALKDTTGMLASDYVDSPYEEVRNPRKYPNMKLDLKSESSFRATIGFSYRISFLELHGDFALASQPILTAGLSFWFGAFGGKDELPLPEKTEQLK